MEVWAPMSTPAQIITVLAAAAIAAAATWRVLRRRMDPRQLPTLLAAAHAARRDRLTGSGSRFAFHEAMAAAAGQHLAAVAEPTEINLNGHPLTVTASACAGVSALTMSSSGDVRLALVWSDTAMRSTKQASRGQVAVFEPASPRRRTALAQPAPVNDAEGGVTR